MLAGVFIPNILAKYTYFCSLNRSLKSSLLMSKSNSIFSFNCLRKFEKDISSWDTLITCCSFAKHRTYIFFVVIVYIIVGLQPTIYWYFYNLSDFHNPSPLCSYTLIPLAIVRKGQARMFSFRSLQYRPPEKDTVSSSPVIPSRLDRGHLADSSAVSGSPENGWRMVNIKVSEERE